LPRLLGNFKVNRLSRLLLEDHDARFPTWQSLESSRFLRIFQPVRTSANMEMVPRRGLEPPRPCERQHLKLVRLPIPPPGHGIVDMVVGGGA
jgi:hypothetical protein